MNKGCMDYAEFQARLQVIESARRNVEALTRVTSSQPLDDLIINALRNNIKVMNDVSLIDLDRLPVGTSENRHYLLQMFEKGLISRSRLGEAVGIPIEDSDETDNAD